MAPSRFCDALAEALAASEFLVRSAPDVPTALEAFDEDKFAAVVAQAQLGARSGMWLLEWLKVLQPTTFTTLLSARSDVERRAHHKIDLVLRAPLPPGAIVGRLAALAPVCRTWEPKSTRPTREVEPLLTAEGDR
jgi:DNA-binding response OmpR family regulator